MKKNNILQKYYFFLKWITIKRFLSKIKMKRILDKMMIFWARFMKNHSKFIVWGKNNLKTVIEENKNLIIIFGHPLCEPCQKIMFKLPILFLKTKKKKITLKFCNIKENWKDCKCENIEKVPTLIHYKDSKQELKIDNPEEIFAYFNKI